jgi:hypothetical protein
MVIVPQLTGIETIGIQIFDHLAVGVVERVHIRLFDRQHDLKVIALLAVDETSPEEVQTMQVEIQLRREGRGSVSGREAEVLKLLMIVAQIFIKLVFVDQEVSDGGGLRLISTCCLEELCEVRMTREQETELGEDVARRLRRGRVKGRNFRDNEIDCVQVCLYVYEPGGGRGGG